VFLEGALGIRQGELGALRWLSCDFDNMSISVQHSYYWRRGGNLKSTKTEASAKFLPMHPSLKHSLQEWRSQSLYNKPEDFVFPSERLQGIKPLDLASVLKKKIQPAFRRIGITGVGWHTFRHSVGTMLAEMGEHQLTIRDYLRHSNLHVTNKYLQATSKTKRFGAGQIGRRYFADGYFAENKPNPMSAVWNRSRMGPFSFCAYRPLTSPDLPGALLWSVLGPWSPVPKCDAPGAPISVEEHTSMARRQSQNPPLQNSSAIPALPWPLRPRLRYSPGLAPTTRLNALLNAAPDS
jgi:hypothetical protein